MKNKTIILSIHPRHVQKILLGEKQYEYRKRIPIDIKHIIVYATAPLKKIVAVIEVDTVLKDNPQNIWEQTKNESGISYSFFTNYFSEATTAYAIKFRSVYKLPTPIDISIIGSVKCAPQAYMYINESLKILCKKFNLNNDKL